MSTCGVGRNIKLVYGSVQTLTEPGSGLGNQILVLYNAEKVPIDLKCNLFNYLKPKPPSFLDQRDVVA